MILGTKARYAVMAMVDLARYSNGRPVTLADIASRQEISLAYLEQLFPKLKKSNLVKPVRGPGGGYLLAGAANEIWILDIIEAVDESLKMTRCSQENSGGCMSDKARCITHSLWEGLGWQIEEYLRNISLEDVCERKTTRRQTPKNKEATIFTSGPEALVS